MNIHIREQKPPGIATVMSSTSMPRGSSALLSSIRDETPELVEDEQTRPCQPGDRIVIAARRQHVAAVVRHLAG